MRRWTILISIITIALLLASCSPDNEGGFEDDYTMTSVSPATIASGLNFPWGIDFINNPDNDGIGAGSVLAPGNLLVTNRGSVGQFANSVVQVDPHSGASQIYSNMNQRDLNGEPAVNGPMDVAFNGPFVWIANDNLGLGTVAITDPNPSKSPNGPTGTAGEPIDGPTGTGVFGSDDFGFIVLSVFPDDESEDVPQNTKIEVRFSQPVDPQTITKDNFVVDVKSSPMSPDPANPEGIFEFSPDFTRVEYVYDGYLAEATEYAIIIDDDVTDYRGFRIDGDPNSPGPDEYESIFTTGSGNPLVIWVNPYDGASMVSVDSIVEVGFSEPIRESSVSSTAFMLLDQEGDRVDGTINVYEDLIKARFVPDEPLEMNANYTVQVTSKVEDLAGNPLDQDPGGYPDPFESRFNTGAADTNPPFVASTYPADGAQAVDSNAVIAVTFSEDIDPSSLLGQYFILSASYGDITGSISWVSESELEFTPSVDLREDASFTITIMDILTDAVGNNLDGDSDGVPGGNFMSHFSTGFERLYVTSSFPAGNATGVSISSSIYVNFSKPVNPATISPSSFYLSRESQPGVIVPAVVSVNPGNTGATLKPDALMDEDTRYEITVTNDVTDVPGNPLDQEPGNPLDPFTAGFTTGGEDTTPPCVIETQPGDGATNVPVGTSVTAIFQEPVLPASITSSTFILTGPGGTIPGQFTYEGGNATVVFHPTIELITSEDYTITLTSDITDASGNGLDGDCDGSTGPDYTATFTTGVGGIVINEVIVDPQQDWNDSEGGDGIEFNGTPGTGSITTSDEWIEIYNATSQSFDISNWTLEMIDSTPEVHVIGSGGGTEVLYPPTSTLTNFAPGSYFILGNPIGSNNNDTYVVLKNSLGVVIDDVEIGDDPEGDGDDDGAPEPGEDGNADDISNEAVARFPNGFDSDVDPADFQKQAATLGADNSGSMGSGPFAGASMADVGLIGMSSIVSAGMAPDELNPMSMLYFVCHADRQAIYGIDFDDGAYYAFTGVEGPMAIEFVPFYDDTGQSLPGNGYVFVADPEAGNIVRVRLAPSGPIGDPNTIAIPDEQGNDYILYFGYPNLVDPIGLAYSAEHDRIYIACRGNGQILEITPEGVLTEIFETGLGSDAIGGIDVGDMGSGDVVFLTFTGGERIDTGDGPNGAVMYFDPHP